VYTLLFSSNWMLHMTICNQWLSFYAEY
jgi:hypothetical protein